MAGRIRIPPYKPLGINAQGAPSGGYYDIDAHAGFFNALPPVQLGLQAAQGAVGIAGVLSEHLGSDNEATVKAADTKLGEAEQALLFDPQSGYLNLQGQAALQQAPAVRDAYSEAQARTLDTAADDDQRRMLQELADKRLASFNEVVARHGTAQRQSWYDQVGEQRIAAMWADAALHWSSDALLRRALGTARAEVRERAERKGWDSPLIEAALRRETSRILVSAIGAAVNRDPERARSLRTRYAAVIEDKDRAALDALLAKALTRERAKAAATEILNAAPSEGHHPTPQWRVQRADAITDPAVRAATIRHLNRAAAAAEAQARTLGEQVLARVLKDGLTDPSQIPVSEWVTLDTVRRHAIETRLDHNAADTEPAPNPALVDELATQMTQVPDEFARRDLVPEIAHLPLPQWQRFRDWQAGLRRNDPATQSEAYAFKRGLQLASRMLPASTMDDDATNIRARLVEDIDTQRRIAGNSPDDMAIREMILRRPLPGPARVDLVQNRFRRGLGSPPTEQDPIEDRMEKLRRGLQIDPVAKMIPGGGGAGRLSGAPRMPTAAGSHGGGGRSVGRGSASVKDAPSSGGSGTTGVAGGRAAGAGTSAQPTSKGPATSSSTGTAAGQTIGGVSSGSARRSLPRLNAPNKPTTRPSNSSSPPSDSQRHHEVIQASWKPGKKDPIEFSPEAQRFFDGKIIRVMKGDHKYNDDHRKYNELVRAAIEKYLAEHPKIDRLKMNTADAKKLYETAVINNPEVQEFRAKMFESNQKFRAKYPDWREGQ